MKILGISGSPRSDGNTDILVKRALDICKGKGAKTEFISLSGLDMEYCSDCDFCVKENQFRCSKDDDISGILEKMKDSKAKVGEEAPIKFVSHRYDNEVKTEKKVKKDEKKEKRKHPPKPKGFNSGRFDR